MTTKHSGRCALLLRAVAVGAMTCLPAVAQPIELFVWNRGDDSATGSRSEPLATLGEAIKRVRGNGKPTIISLASGIYRVEKPIVLTSQDSRTADAPLLIRRAGRRGEVVLTGGLPLPNDQWRPLSAGDRLAEFLPKESRNAVRVIELAGDAAAEAFLYRPDPDKNEHPPLLAWSGYVLQRSQWPNLGYAYFDKTLAKGPSTRFLKATEKPAAYSFEQPTGGSFTLLDPLDFDRLNTEFQATGDMRVVGYLNNDWFYQTEMLGRVLPGKKALQLVRYTRYGVGNEKIKLPRRMRLEGAISYLDQPGEWRFDHEEKKLYLWPVKPFKSDGPAVQVTGGAGLIQAKGVDYVKLERLTFEGFGDVGVNFQGGSNITIAGCEFRAASGVAVRVQGGTHNTIRSCDVHDTTSGFVMTGLPENRKTLTPDHLRMLNNHFWDLRGRWYGSAASVGGVGVYFAHNLLHDMQASFSYGQNDFLAEYNEFYNMGFEMGDWNPCYRGADLSLFNNTFRYNFFHHLIETPGSHPIAAIRADDNASGLNVHANIFFKTGRCAVQFHGPNSSITDNFLVGTRLLWHSGQSPLERISKSQFMQKKRAALEKIEAEVAAGTRRFQDKANILGKAEQVFGEQGWKNNPIWISKYPNFANSYDINDYHHGPWAQTFAVVKNNYIDDSASDPPIHLHGRNPNKTYQDIVRGIPNTAEIEFPKSYDPRRVFKSPGALNFQYNKRPPKGVDKIDFGKIGLVRDQYRKQLPDKKQYRREVVRLYRGVRSTGGELDLRKINRRYRPPKYLRTAER